MQKATLITLVGMPGAGKSTCVDFLESKGIPSVYFGGITIDEVKRRGLDVNEVNEKVVREDIRLKEGKDAYAKRVLQKIKTLEESGESVVVVDGLYSWTEYKLFKAGYDDQAIVIAVMAPRKMRHDRLIHRPVRPLSEEAVTSREYAEIENLEKGGPIANADYTVINNTTETALLNSLKAVLDQAGLKIS